MQRELMVFRPDEYDHLHDIEKNNENDYLGCFYALEHGDQLKIGSTRKPHQRLMSLKRTSEKYGEKEIGRIAVSAYHTNYADNEKKLHVFFSKSRKDGTELFDISLESFIENIPDDLTYLDDSDEREQRADCFFNAVKNFALGKTPNIGNTYQNKTYANEKENHMGALAFVESEFSGVRIFDRNGEPWFVGKDICQRFGDKNHNRSLSRIDEDDRMMAEVADAKGRKQNAVIVNESGLYALLFSMAPQKTNKDGVSDAYPIAVQERIDKIRRFKHWVTSEVLPAIRKHGVYAIDEMLNNPDAMIAALTELKAERERRKELQEKNANLIAKNANLITKNSELAVMNVALNDQVMVQNQQIAEMEPKVSYYDIVLNCRDLVTISAIAKDYGWSAIQMNNYLKQQKIQFKQGSMWLLYQKYAKNGYTSTKTINYPGNDGTMHTTAHTYWTQKGRLFLYELLRKDDIYPLIEKEKAEKEDHEAVLDKAESA